MDKLETLLARLKAGEEVSTADILAAAKGGRETKPRNRETTVYGDDGEILAVRCSYTNYWFHPSFFGRHSTTKNGLNRMCKKACNRWYANNSAVNETIKELNALKRGGVIDDELYRIGMAKAEEAKKVRVLEGIIEDGFKTAEECVAHYKDK